MDRPLLVRVVRLARLARARALAPVFVFALITFAQPPPAVAGELGKASNDVHGSGSSARATRTSPERGRTGRHGSAHDGGDHDSDSPLVSLFCFMFLSPFYIPHVAVEGGPEPEGGWSLAPYPYGDGAAGYFEPVAVSPPDPDSADEAQEAPARELAASRRVVAFQATAEGMPPVGGVGRLQMSARLQTAFRLELDTAYALYLERPDAASTPGWSGAWLGHSHVAFEFARSERVQFRAGLGVRHWADASGSALGLDLLYGIDVFWGRPVTTSLEVTGGSVGHAWVAEPRGTVGFMVGPAEVFGGYDAVWIGGAGPTAYLGGPVIGTRAYF